MRNCSRICWCSWGLIDAVSGYGDVVYSISNIDIWHPFNLWLIRQLKINFQDILLLIFKNISDVGILCPFNLLQISQLKITVSEFEEPDHDDEPLGRAILVWSQAGIFFLLLLQIISIINDHMLIFFIFTHPFNESFIFLVFLVFFPHAHQKFHKEQALRLFLFEYSTIQTQERLEVEFNWIQDQFFLQQSIF